MKLARLAILSFAAVALAAVALDSEAGGRSAGGARGGGHHGTGSHPHHHGHPVRGFYIWPGTYWWPGYYYPAMVVPVTEPYWYYCAESAAYYPHVQECPSGWQPVRPATPPPLG